MTPRRRLTGATLAALLTTLLVALVPPPAAAAPASGGPAAASACVNVSAQVDALDAQAATLESQIAAHNAQVIDTTSAAAVNAYNARADQLNAQRDALNAQIDGLNLTAAQCYSLDAQVGSALEGRPGDWTYTPGQSTVDALQQRLDQLGDRSAVPLPGPRPNGAYPITPELRPFYEAIRPYTPRRDEIGTGPLQGQRRPSAGDPDPAYPGAVIPSRDGRPLVAVDHVVPLSEIMAMPGFLQLNAYNMLLVVNAPVNLQWLSGTANSAKRERPVSTMGSVDPDWARDQEALRDRAVQRLRQAIDLLLEQQRTVGS